MTLIVQQKALHVAHGLRPLLASIRKRDRQLFEQVRRAMHSVVLNLGEAQGNDSGTARARFASACGSAKEVRAGLQLAAAYGYLHRAHVAELDVALDEVCAMSWRLSGR
jgi:four helix bundle protein